MIDAREDCGAFPLRSRSDDCKEGRGNRNGRKEQNSGNEIWVGNVKI